jgi:hypothetical protein
MNTAKRAGIRDTWANIRHYGQLNDSAYNFVVIFAIGKDYTGKPEKWVNIQYEIDVHRDILLLDMRDEYNQLILKGHHTMSWILERLPQVEHIIKTDDDVFLNMFIWLEIVRTLKHFSVSCYVACFVWIHPVCLRDHPQYAVSIQEYKYANYPSFCSGMGYLMTRTALAAILEASKYIPLFVRDDPYFTGMTAYAAHVPLIKVPEESFILWEGEVKDVSDLLSKPILAAHNLTMSQWFLLWEHITLSHNHGDKQNQLQLVSVVPRDRILPEIKTVFQLSYNSSAKDTCSSSMSQQEITFIVKV